MYIFAIIMLILSTNGKYIMYLLLAMCYKLIATYVDVISTVLNLTIAGTHDIYVYTFSN